MSKAIITSHKDFVGPNPPTNTGGGGGGGTVVTPTGPYTAAVISDCTSGTNYTAEVDAGNPVSVGAVVHYVQSGQTSGRCGTVASVTTSSATSNWNAVIQEVSHTCGDCSAPTGSATVYICRFCDYEAQSGDIKTYGQTVGAYDTTSQAPSIGDYLKISKSGASNKCVQVIAKREDAPAYSSGSDWNIGSTGFTSCNNCLGVTTRPPLYVVALINQCESTSDPSVIARVGDKEVNIGNVVKYVTTSGSSSTVACGTVYTMQYDRQSAAVIADGVADCSSCDDSTSGSDDWFTVWQCDTDIIEIVYNKDSVSGVALDEVVKYTKVGDSSSYCGTVTSNAIAGTYTSGDLYVESVETDCTSCASGGGSNFTITPCDGGSDIIADDSYGENPSVGDVVGYSDGVSDEECGTISGTTSSSASYTIESSGYIDCDDCGTGGGGGGEGP